MNLPPLNAMRAFEVVARTGSFTRAARELGTSSAAVSQHVRNLEDYFGKSLFTRNGNRLIMTDAGHAIFPPTSQALGDIARVARRVLEGEALPRLVVSVPFSLAEPWLAPRLGRLAGLHPRLAIDVRVEDDPIDLARHNIDLRVSYGAYHYPDLQSFQLFHDEVLPVCAPRFWRDHSNPHDGLEAMHESLFIHTTWGPSYASHPTWSDWFEKASVSFRPDPSHGRRVGFSSLAIAAAREGVGIALAQRMLTRSDLEAGRLIALSSVGLRLGHPYQAFLPPSQKRGKQVEEFLELLRS